MFCYQCEQTAKGEGCTKVGVCGKTPETAALQDLLMYTLKGLSLFAAEARKRGIVDPETDHFVMKSIFSTLTNVDFDPNNFVNRIQTAAAKRDALAGRLNMTAKDLPYGRAAAAFAPPESKEAMIETGETVGVFADPGEDANIRALRELLVYGIKGVAAYMDHAVILGEKDEEVVGFVYKALAATFDPNRTLEDYLGLVLECGRINLRAMELLDAGHTRTFGHPEPTRVTLGAGEGKAILVSGHDLKDLEDLLKQTEGKGINVYTHGDMLPAHGYPALKKYPHLFGHYGTAWQNQAKEFDAFPGPILMTTNCIQKPRDSYIDRIYTTGNVGFPGVTHVENGNFAPVVEKALSMEGFREDVPGKTIMTGFARNAVMSVADAVIEAVKNKQIRHFFLVAGCDGAKPGRNYYTEFVEKVPEDCVVLTLACGKFRFFDKDLGAIGGIPRLLDVGQCNDAYSAVKIAEGLAEAFQCGVNDLPLSMVLSWYEQKACAILLSLLYLGVRDIRLGPSLPAFVTPDILNVLVEKFNIMPIESPEDDLKAILG